MSSVIAIWATAVATAELIARIGAILANAATPRVARRTAREAAADRDGAAATASAAGAAR